MTWSMISLTIIKFDLTFINMDSYTVFGLILNIKKLRDKWLGSLVFLIKSIGTIIIIFLKNFGHLLIKMIYTDYLTSLMLSSYRIVPSLVCEYPSSRCYFELSRYSHTWKILPHHDSVFHPAIYQTMTFQTQILIY